MYQSSYSEVLENAPQTVRANERAAVLHSIRLLERAEQSGLDSREAIEALSFLRRLWEFFLVHLASDESKLRTNCGRILFRLACPFCGRAERVRTER